MFETIGCVMQAVGDRNCPVNCLNQDQVDMRIAVLNALAFHTDDVLTISANPCVQHCWRRLWERLSPGAAQSVASDHREVPIGLHNRPKISLALVTRQIPLYPQVEAAACHTVAGVCTPDHDLGAQDNALH